ncbi:oligopeptidase B [Salinimicrobium catena]|uniref:Proline-specific endopeptidase n=1 Tax=Salinimicrobium catena TaxID=390640 RepID=A0A1H5J7F6_9FLAO|nr:S9 family peptidase [Salinimicrobium catena]SDK84950.1 oligopeptidase B [Salinimicrobium catena]SEE48350.1 oligopeptidase B [Salinimicrobium catena]
MKRFLYITFVAFLTTASAGLAQVTDTQKPRASSYPEAPDAMQKDSILTIHGDSRTDPYFWMRLSDEQKMAEDPDAQTQKVLEYLKAENAYTKTVMKDTDSLQKELFEEIVGRIKKTDESVPYFKNGYWYYTRYEKGGEYPIYARKKGSMEAEEEILLNVNEMAEGHDYFSVTGLEVSPNNNLLAFGVDTLSRRIYHIKFKNLETGEILNDVLENTTGGGAWANDNETYFYTTKNKVSLLSEKIFRHKLGEPNKQDDLVYQEEDPSFYIGVYKSKSDEFIIIGTSSTVSNDYYVLDANDPTGEFRQFASRERDHEYTIHHFKDKFYVVTNWDAKNFRLMETPENATSKENWKQVIPHREDVLLTGIEIFNDHLVVSERSNALTQLRIMNQKNGEEHYLEFDEPAYVAYTSVNPEFNTDKLRYIYSSLTTPMSTIEYDMETKAKKVLKQEEIIGGHDPGEYVTERIFAEARDGTKIPLTLVYKKSTEKSKETPLLLYAYGSYGSSMDPWFRSDRLSLLDRGFIFAIAHIRGGQEMGREWYEAGKMFNKKNTFTDFVDSAEYLIDNNYTSADHLYAMGGSAGGLLMGAVVNMAPENFNGVIAAVPFVDVVSTMLDESIPLTTNEFDEWGNPKNKDSYEYMLSYSPYDNVTAQDYPNMLVTTGLFDSQVQYWEPAKWVAKLRDKKTDDNLLLLHTNMEAGHGGASGRFERYKEVALEYAFLLKLEGLVPDKPAGTN